MPYELIVLNKKWFASNNSSDKLGSLVEVLNKGYSKPMARYGIIESPRIKHPSSLLQCLQLDIENHESTPNGKEKDFYIMLLLGSKPDFKRLEADFGYRRQFNPEIMPLSNSRNSDIPNEFASEFGALKSENVNLHILSPVERLPDDLSQRVLATIGVKTIYDDGYFSQADLLDSVKHYELTAFTSFMRGTGTDLMNYITSEFIMGPSTTFLKPDHVNKVVLHAVVIKEHDLVPFYRDVCNFTPSAHPDVLIKVSDTDSHMEDGIKASQDFHISFLRKEFSK